MPGAWQAAARSIILSGMFELTTIPGSSDATLRLVIAAPGFSDVVVLPPAGEVTIGRSSQSAVWIADETVSREHAVLRVAGGLSIEDLGTANGTFVNASRIAPGKPATVRPGDTIVVGDAVLLVMGRTPEASVLEVAGRSIVVQSPVMRCLYKHVDQVAPATINVLFQGETGTGKEVLARRLHERSPRAHRPFAAIACAELPEALVENELFGHEKGAFTGAHEARPGLLESADGGTVFLDEVGELSLGHQAKLLRVMEAKEVRRIGGSESRPLDVRFVSATNKDLPALVARGQFREDLLFRLGGISVRIPPLRERVEEIEPLARAFVGVASKELGRAREPDLTEQACHVLASYSWPGNIRELRSVIQSVVAGSAGRPIGPDELPAALRKETASALTQAESPGRKPITRETVAAALKSTNGNQTRAAKLLGISLRYFIAKLDDYGLPRPYARRPEKRDPENRGDEAEPHT